MVQAEAIRLAKVSEFVRIIMLIYRCLLARDKLDLCTPLQISYLCSSTVVVLLCRHNQTI
jgi:hypothetical protein